MHKIKSQVDNAAARLLMLLIDEDPVGAAESADVASPTKGLSRGVDELVKKSPTLWDLVSDFTSRGGSFGYLETDGRGSEVKTYEGGHSALLLAKDSSKSPEATVREIAWQLGLSGVLPADVAPNVKPGVSQTALAALIGAQVRSELLSAGENNIGLAHPNAQHYLDIYEQNSSDPRTAYAFLYRAALADYEKARRDSIDSWQATIVPNSLVLPQN